MSRLGELEATDPALGLFAALQIEDDPRVLAALIRRIIREIERERRSRR